MKHTCICCPGTADPADGKFELKVALFWRTKRNAIKTNFHQLMSTTEEEEEEDKSERNFFACRPDRTRLSQFVTHKHKANQLISETHTKSIWVETVEAVSTGWKAGDKQGQDESEKVTLSEKVMHTTDNFFFFFFCWSVCLFFPLSWFRTIGEKRARLDRTS